MRSIRQRKNALPQVMTKQQKFEKLIKDCSSLNLQESFVRNFKKRSFALASLSKGRLDSILKVSKVNPTMVIDVDGVCVFSCAVGIPISLHICRNDWRACKHFCK